MTRSLLSAIGRCSRFVLRELQGELEPFGIGVAEFRVVGLLMDESVGLSQAQLCARLGVAAPTLSVALRKLETRGAVTRRTDPDDARIKRVVLRKKFDLRPVNRMLAALEARVTDSISKRDVATARRVLLRVADRLEHVAKAGEGN